jgi:hypothetical protein
MTTLSRSSDAAYYRFVCTGSKKLIVSFSHVDMPMFKFSQTRVLDALDSDTLFLNCPGNEYYLNGIPGIGSSFSRSIDALGNFIRRHAYNDVTFIGNSMGAYGALVYGLELGARVIAFAPEVILGIPGGASSKKMRNATLRNGALQNFIDRALLYRDCTEKLYIVYGELDFADVTCGAFLQKRFGIPVYAIKNAPHSVAPYIEQIIGLRKMAFSLLNDAPEYLLPSELIRDRYLIKLGYDTYVSEKKREINSEILYYYQNNEHFAHIYIKQVAMGAEKRDIDYLTMRSTNLLYHNAQFLYDAQRWASLSNRDDITQTAINYSKNSTLGDYHFFIKACLQADMLSRDELVDIGLSTDLVRAL